MGKLKTIIKHLWQGEADTARAVPEALLKRLAQRVAASEQRHSGEIRICVEASLPWSYLSQLGRDCTMRQLTRQRAVTMFGKLRVWDTEHNNGVLIYLLLAEHAIEIVADRGITRRVPQATWDTLVAGMREDFRSGRFERGLMQAVDAVDGILSRHFPLAAGDANPNELADAPDLR